MIVLLYHKYGNERTTRSPLNKKNKLGVTMSQQLSKEGNTLSVCSPNIKKQTKGNNNEGKINWFAKTFPHFFTKKVLENRTRELEVSTPPPRAAPVFMKRKLGKKQYGFIGLKQISRNQLKFFCDQSSREWLIEPLALIALITSATMSPTVMVNAEWVGIRVGSETLTVNRAQLVCAIRHFKLLATP